MLERLLLPANHAIAILMSDHDKAKGLFDQFEKAKSPTEKERLIKKAIAELKVHASIEEEIFYPAVRKRLGKDLMNEADEEHHVARVLIAELDCGAPGDDHRDAKFTVLAESVRHHIKEEEGEMLPKAKKLDIDFEALGQRILERKKSLKEKGIPADAEHAMVKTAPGKNDTPAAASRRVAPQLARTRKRSGSRPTARSRGQRAGR